jgi:hypothetical protein
VMLVCLQPMLTSVAEKKEKPSVALQQAVPRILQSASLGLPCKQMCDSITTICGCGREATFGEVFGVFFSFSFYLWLNSLIRRLNI